MIHLRFILTLALCLPAASPLLAQKLKPESELQKWEVQPLTEDGWVEYDLKNEIAEATNGVRIIYGEAVLTAEKARLNQNSGEVVADGNVRIQQADQLWVGQHMVFNFKNYQLEAQEFRTGKTPMFVEGEGLHGDLT